MKTKKNWIFDHTWSILLGGLLSPIVFGFIGQIFFGNGNGAGLGAILMIISWIVLFVGIIIEEW